MNQLTDEEITNTFFEVCLDAERFRWLTDDHADLATRERRNALLGRMAVMSNNSVCMDIDIQIREAEERVAVLARPEGEKK